MRGDTAVKSPPKEEEGPTCRSVLAPVRVRLFAVLPSCVNCLRDNVPVEKLPELTCIPYPAARITVDAVFGEKYIPVEEPVLDRLIFPLKVFPAEFHPTLI
jgi:hypothetical protein